MTSEGKEFYINEGIFEVCLGREKILDDSYFQIGENNTISKKHARVFWDKEFKCWKIQNLSKNKIYVNFESLQNTDQSRILQNMSPILISKMKIFFLLPRED